MDVIIVPVAVDHDDRVRVAPLREGVPQLVGVLPRDVRDAELLALGRDVELQLPITGAERDHPVSHRVQAEILEDARHDLDGVRLVDRPQDGRRLGVLPAAAGRRGDQDAHGGEGGEAHALQRDGSTEHRSKR